MSPWLWGKAPKVSRQAAWGPYWLSGSFPFLVLLMLAQLATVAGNVRPRLSQTAKGRVSLSLSPAGFHVTF